MAILDILGFDRSNGQLKRYTSNDTINGSAELLTDNRIYYVRTNGNDNNTGTSDTPSGAWATLSRAVSEIIKLNLNGKVVTIKVADGTYNSPVNISVPLNGTVVFEGNVDNPSLCNLNVTNANAFTAAFCAVINVKGFRITTTGIGSAFYAYSNGIILFDKMNFGSCASAQLTASDGGRIAAYALVTGTYTISGNAVSHVHAYANGAISIGYQTVTLTNTPNFSSYFAGSAFGFITFEGTAFNGSATGQRWYVHKNGLIDTNSAGPNYLPGNIAGVTTTETGGQYI